MVNNCNWPFFVCTFENSTGQKIERDWSRMISSRWIHGIQWHKWIRIIELCCNNILSMVIPVVLCNVHKCMVDRLSWLFDTGTIIFNKIFIDLEWFTTACIQHFGWAVILQGQDSCRFSRLCCTLNVHKNHCEDSQYNGYQSLFEIKEDKMTMQQIKKSQFSLQKGHCNDVNNQRNRKNKEQGKKKEKWSVFLK